MPRVLALPILFLALYATAQTAPVIHRLDGSSVSTAEAERIADAELAADHVTGAQLAILNHGRTVWTHAYGLRNVEQKLPMLASTNIWAASITKSVFATWVMRLAQDGKVNLDEPIAHMLSKPLTAYEYTRELGTELEKDPRWQRVTPRIVLSHTSGLGNVSQITEPDKKLHLHFGPGERYAYSGDGLNLLQVALEEKLGAPLDTLMQRDLFQPLGMAQTGMVWHDSFAENTALRYEADGKLIGMTRRMNARAGGNMATDVEDLAHFTEALLGGKLLNAATQKEMFRPQVWITSAHQFPTLDTTQGTEGKGVGLAYGLGWGLLTRTKFGPAFFKEGHGDGGENYMICFPKSGTCMVLLTNSDNGELAFRPLLEKLIGDTVTPWVWEHYTRELILAKPEHAAAK